MKTCPVCGTSYDARVDFCFRDGEVLVDGPAAATPPAQVPEDEFDRPLPSADPPAAAPPAADVPSAADLPQPRFVSSAADLPEPAFLNRETVEETAPFPTTTPSAPPRAPIPDDETLPMPLDGAVIAPPVAAEPVPVSPPPAPAAAPPAPPPAPEPAPEPAPFVAPVDAGFSPSPAPLPPIQPEPELDDWAEPAPAEEEERGGAPWALIGVAALLLLGIGGFFAWKSTQGGGATDPGPAVADLGPELTPEPEPEPKTQPRTPRPDPEPATPVVEPEPEPEPVVAPKPPDATPNARDPEPAVTSVEPAATEPAQPWDAPDPADTPQAGTLKLKTTPPGATIFVDGARVGTGPMDFATTQGRHKVRAEADGYKPQEIMVSLNGESAAANLTLQRDVQTQQVMLYGPAGAKSVKVAGQTINALPATISLPVGRHVFTVVQADGTSFQVSQSIAQGAQANVMLLPPE